MTIPCPTLPVSCAVAGHRWGGRLAAWVLAAGLAALAPPSLAQTPPPATERASRHALIIGIGQYSRAGIPTLHGVVHDMASARQMAEAMDIPASQTLFLRDQDASAERIRRELSALGQRVAPGDRVFIYYSGHGTRWHDPTDPHHGCTEGLLAADGQPLTNTELADVMRDLSSRTDKLMVFYDACFSGGVVGAPTRTRSLVLGQDTISPKFNATGAPQACATPSNFRTRALSLVMRERGGVPENVVHIAASAPDQVSFDNPSHGGYATRAWRDCMLGQAADADGSGAVSVEEITRCAQAQVSQALAGQPGITGQTLTLGGNLGFVPAWIGKGAGVAPVPSASSASAASTTAPASASPADMLAEVHQQRDGSRQLAVELPATRLRIGDPLRLTVTPPREGYLYLALAGSDGQSLYLLYPNRLASDNRVRAGVPLTLPTAGWRMEAGGPPGVDTLLVMVTDSPRPLDSLGAEKVGPFMKTLLDPQGRARLQALLSQGQAGCTTSGAGAGRCTDAFASALVKLETVAP